MSLIRQVWLLLTLTLVLAFAGAIGVSVHSARHYLQTQLNLKNNDAAQSLALTLSQQKGDRIAMELSIASQFDTGYYQQIRLLGTGGLPIVERTAPPMKQQAPAWFTDLLGIETDAGTAQVSNGWNQIGRL